MKKRLIPVITPLTLHAAENTFTPAGKAMLLFKKVTCMPLATFQIYNFNDFSHYILNNQFSREITFIQNHHTWLPNYTSLQTHPGEMYWLESMRSSHIQERGWADIGQNITVFPSGNIGLCRPVDVQPAGIFGANRGAICIENLGNFDAGKDAMTQAHREAIIGVNALLCIKFKLLPIPAQVVYHHWYDKTGKRFPEDRINAHLVTTNDQKTCPGTAFFGGHTVQDAAANFYPLITTRIAQLGNAVPPAVTRTVSGTSLNVRSGPGTGFNILRLLVAGTVVTVYAEMAGWSKISNTADEWVFSSFLQ